MASKQTSHVVAHPERGEGAIGPYLAAIRAHPLLVTAVTLAALLGTLAWSALRVPDYEASAQILVTPLPQDDPTFVGIQLLRDSNEPTRTVQTAATLVRSAPGAAELTARRLGPAWAPQRVLDSVVVEPVGESNILAVTGRAPDATSAARLANEFAGAALEAHGRVLQAQVKRTIAELKARQRSPGRTQAGEDSGVAERLAQLETFRDGDDPTLWLSQSAIAPERPTGPPPLLVWALSLVAGFTLASGAALLAELFDRRIRDEHEALILYPLPVLSRIPELPRDLRDGVASPVSMPPAAREAFRTIQVQLDQTPAADRRALMITSASTGDGKSTCAVNLAFALVIAGHRVILMDLDLRKPDVAKVLGLEEERGLVSLLTPGSRLSDVLVQAPQLPPLRVAVAGTDGDVVQFEALTRRLPEIITEAHASADYVILDTPPLGEVSDALTVAGQVDDVLVVMRPGHTDRGHLAVMRDLLERSGRTPLGALMVGVAGATKSGYYAYGLGARANGDVTSRENGAAAAPLGRLLRR